jgi:hypothetical protein
MTQMREQPNSMEKISCLNDDFTKLPRKNNKEKYYLFIVPSNQREVSFLVISESSIQCILTQDKNSIVLAKINNRLTRNKENWYFRIVSSIFSLNVKQKTFVIMWFKKCKWNPYVIFLKHIMLIIGRPVKKI